MNYVMNYVGVRPCILFTLALMQCHRAEQAATVMHPTNGSFAQCQARMAL
jgi:hypothetical protein